MIKYIIIIYILFKNLISLQIIFYICYKLNNIITLLYAFYNLETFRFLVLSLLLTIKYENRSYVIYIKAVYSWRIVNALFKGNFIFC